MQYSGKPAPVHVALPLACGLQLLSAEQQTVPRAHEPELLHAYHDTLVANGVTDYDYDTLVDDYRVGISCGWMIPVLAVGSLDFTSERAISLWTTVIERTQNALLDHGVGQ